MHITYHQQKELFFSPTSSCLVDGTIIFTITLAVAGIPEWLLVGRMRYLPSKYNNNLFSISKKMQLK